MMGSEEMIQSGRSFRHKCPHELGQWYPYIYDPNTEDGVGIEADRSQKFLGLLVYQTLLGAASVRALLQKNKVEFSGRQLKYLSGLHMLACVHVHVSTYLCVYTHEHAQIIHIPINNKNKL